MPVSTIEPLHARKRGIAWMESETSCPALNTAEYGKSVGSIRLRLEKTEKQPILGGCYAGAYLSFANDFAGLSS